MNTTTYRIVTDTDNIISVVGSELSVKSMLNIVFNRKVDNKIIISVNRVVAGYYSNCIPCVTQEVEIPKCLWEN